MGPYRIPAGRAEGTEGQRKRDCPEAELIPVLCVFWILSLTRVAAGLVRHEVFGGDASLAVLAVGLVRYILKDAGAWWWRRRKIMSENLLSLFFPYGRGQRR